MKTGSLRIIALFLIFVFTFTSAYQPLYAQSAVSLQAGILPSHFELTEHFQVPEKLASLQEFKTFEQSTQKPFVLLIENAHAEPDAQKSIQGLINYYAEKYGVRDVALEGVSSNLDATLLKSAPDAKLLEAILNENLESGELGGAAYAAVFGNDGVSFWGVEDKELYEKNIAQLIRGLKEQKDVLKSWQSIQSDLNSLKKKNYSEKLLRFDTAILDYQTNPGTVFELMKASVSLRNALPDRALYPHLAALWEVFSETRKISGVSDAGLRKEINRLSKKTKQALRLPAEIKEFHHQEQLFQTEQIQLGQFAQYLQETLQKNRRFFSVSPALAARIEPARLLSETKGSFFVEELDAYLKEVKSQLAQTPAEKELSVLDESLTVLYQLITFKLSHAKWEKLRNNPQGALFSAESGVQAQNFKPLYTAIKNFRNLLESDFSVFSQFYETAQERERAFIKNFTTQLQKRNAQSAILITGGFHTTGLLKAIQQAGVSYAVITPKINQVSGDDRYFDFMRGEISWKDYLIPENGKIDLYSAFHRAMADRILSRVSPDKKMGFLKTWRDGLIRRLADEGRLSESATYTGLLDPIIHERLGENDREVLKSDWLKRVDQFIDQLTQLRALFTPTPISTHTAEWWGAGNGLARGATLNAATLNPSMISPENISQPAGARFELRKTAYVQQQRESLSRVNQHTIVSRQLEAGLPRWILKEIEKRYGREIASLVAQTTVTGGLGALMHDLFEAWQMNGADTISINPIYEKIKAQTFVTLPRPIPEAVRLKLTEKGISFRGNGKVPYELDLGFILREILMDSKLSGNKLLYEIDFSLAAPSKAFVEEAKRKNSRAMRIFDLDAAGKVVAKPLRLRVYQTRTTFSQGLQYYIDIVYDDEHGNPVNIFDEVYPDEPHPTSLWRDVHIAAYHKATKILIERLKADKKIKEKTFLINNEVFTALPTGHPRMDINHTVYMPGLYQPDARSYELFELPTEWRSALVHDGRIDLTTAIVLDQNGQAIVGVGLAEHTPVLRQRLFAAKLHRLMAYNKDGLRNTNGVLMEKWQQEQRRQLIQAFKRKLKKATNVKSENDQDFFQTLFQAENRDLKKEFMQRNGWIKAASVALFLKWLRDDQQKPLWYENLIRDIQEKTGTNAEGAEFDVGSFVEAVLTSETDDDWGRLFSHQKYPAIMELLMKRVIISNVRRQVPYKGPEKWLEVLGMLKTEKERDSQKWREFREKGPMIVIGGRLWGSQGEDLFLEIKRMIKDLGIEDQALTLENYNIYDAEYLFQAMAGVVMLSDEDLEASATSMMKGKVNGASIIGVFGGADPEIWTFVNTKTGNEVSIFNEDGSLKYKYKEVIAKLKFGEWKLTDGFIVEYSDEDSKEKGGGKRPSSASLFEGIMDLAKKYRQADSRQEIQYNALAASWKVDMEMGQARAHLYVIEEALRHMETAERFLQEMENLSDQEVAELLLLNDLGFEWRDDTTGRVTSHSGIRGFLEGFQAVLKMWNEKGDAKLIFDVFKHHIQNTQNDKAGDIFHYLFYLFGQFERAGNGTPITHLISQIHQLSRRAIAAPEMAQKIEANLEAIDLVQQLWTKLEDRRGSQGLAIYLIDRVNKGDADTLPLLYVPEIQQTIERALVTLPVKDQDAFMKQVFLVLEKNSKLEAFINRRGMQPVLLGYLERQGAMEFDDKASKIRGYFYKVNGFDILIAVNYGESVHGLDRDGKVRIVADAKSYLTKITHYSSVMEQVRGYQVEDYATGEQYRYYDETQETTSLIEKGLPIAVLPWTAQFLKITPKIGPKEIKTQDAVEWLKQVIRENISGAKRSQRFDMPPNTATQHILANLSQKPSKLKEAIAALAAMPAETAQQQFAEKGGQPVGVPAVMALIAFLTPQLFGENLQNWDKAVYERLKKMIMAPDMRAILNSPAIFLEPSDGKGILIAKKLGKDTLVLPIDFSGAPVDSEGKTGIYTNNLSHLEIQGENIYEIYEYTVTEKDSLMTESGRRLMRAYSRQIGSNLINNGWRFAVPVQSSEDRLGKTTDWRFQWIRLVDRGTKWDYKQDETVQRLELRDAGTKDRGKAIRGLEENSFATEITVENMKNLKPGDQIRLAIWAKREKSGMIVNRLVTVTGVTPDNGIIHVKYIDEYSARHEQSVYLKGPSENFGYRAWFMFDVSVNFLLNSLEEFLNSGSFRLADFQAETFYLRNSLPKEIADRESLRAYINHLKQWPPRIAENEQAQAREDAIVEELARTIFEFAGMEGLARAKKVEDGIEKLKKGSRRHIRVIRKWVRGTKTMGRNELRELGDRFLERLASEKPLIVEDVRQAALLSHPDFLFLTGTIRAGAARRAEEVVVSAGAVAETGSEWIFMQESKIRGYLISNPESKLNFNFTIPYSPEPAIQKALLEYLSLLSRLSLAAEFKGRIHIQAGFVVMKNQEGLTALREFETALADIRRQNKQFFNSKTLNASSADAVAEIRNHLQANGMVVGLPADFSRKLDAKEREVALEGIIWADAFPFSLDLIFRFAQMPEITAELLKEMLREFDPSYLGYRSNRLAILSGAVDYFVMMMARNLIERAA